MPRRKTQEEFEKDVMDRLGPEYVVKGAYPGAHGKVPMLHTKCGNEFNKNVHDIITKGSGCPFCNGVKPTLYNEKWIIKNTPAPYHYISGFVNMTTKCKFHCDNCDSDFKQTPRRLINEKIYGCNCSPTKKLTNEEFLDRLGEECLEEYDVLEEYVNIDTKILFKHKSCDTTFKLSPYQFITRHKKKYCPICYYNKSHGEVAITQFLEKNNIFYNKEYVFKDYPQARYDFYLPDSNIIIEFDGKQHYEFIPFFHGTEEEFNNNKLKDLEKNSYCLKNGITMFRIPYTEEDNLETILNEILKEQSSTTIERFIVTE